MNSLRLLVPLFLIASVNPLFAQQRRETSQRWSSGDADRWVQTLDNDLEHLQEDLYYQRGSYPRGLRDQIDDLSQSLTHFQHVLRRGSDADHVRRDFREMDEQLHSLLNTLDRSNDDWLRRQASRIRYSHEQLHYAIERKSGKVSRELLARHAHSLEEQARYFEQLTERYSRRDGRLRESAEDFADEAARFHESIEDGVGMRHLRDDFEEVDEAWHSVVSQLNRSSYGFYLRTAANNVNRVHNQIHDLLDVEHHHQASEPVSTNTPPPQRVPSQRVPQRRPAIEFEIPGIGRFQIPQ